MAKAKSPSKINPRRPVLVNAATLIAQRLNEMLAYESCLTNPDDVYSLHEMRIAGKRLRYTMEVFQPIYARYTDAGTEYGAILQVVKDLQEHLGVLHDADVLVPEILEHLGRLAKAGYGLPVVAEPQDVTEPKNTNERKSKQGKAAGKAADTAHNAKPAKALPIVGVHQVDYTACEDLLTLCTQVRAERDARYTQLTQEWQQIRANQVFERLRALLNMGTGNKGQGTEEKKKRREEEKTGRQRTGNRKQGTEGEDSSFILAPSSLPAPSTLNSQPSTSEEPDAANRQIPQIQRAPGEPGHVAAARRRVPPRPSEKAGEPGKQGREGKQRRDASVSTLSSGSAAKPDGKAIARNGTTRAARHSRAGTDTDSGAGKGGAE